MFRTFLLGLFCCCAAALRAQTTYDHTIPTEYTSVSNYVYFAFPATPPTMGEGTLSLEWAACYTAGHSPGSITVEVSTSTGWQIVLDESDNTSSCVFVSESVTIGASVFADAIAVGAGSLQCRMTAVDGCQPGVGCTLLSDPVVRNLRLAYTVSSAAFGVSAAAICPGGTVTFTDESLNGPSAHEWTFTGGEPATSTLADPVVQYAAPGIYGVTLIVQTNDGTDTLEVPNAVTVLPPPVPNVGSDQDICIGDGAQLQAYGGVEYLWVPDTWLDNASYAAPYSVPADNITYTVLVTDANGCQASEEITVNVHEPPVITVNTGGDIHCLGDTIDLVAEGAVSYVWSPAFYLSSTSGASVQAWPDQDYGWTISAVDQYGCAGSTNIYIDLLPAATTPVVTEVAGALVSTPASGYQWYLAGEPIPGANADSYAPTVNGYYSVVITDANGCQAESAEVFYGSTHVGAIAAPRFSAAVLPGGHAARLEGVVAGAQLTLFDRTGRVVRSQQAAAGNHMLMDLSGLGAGVSVLEMRTANAVEHVTLLIQ